MSQECLVGQVKHVIFENLDNFYRVVVIGVDKAETSFDCKSQITITGQFPKLHKQTTYEFYGNLTLHPRYGEQFAVTHYQQKAPSTKEGLIEYLSSHRFKGIGKVTASRLVDTFGPDVIDIVLENPERLKEVDKLPEKTAENFYNSLVEHRGTEKTYMKLSQLGFGASLADKIYQTYKEETLDVIKENPYILIEDIEGIGFQRADQLAQQLGYDATATERLMAAVYTVVYNQTNNEGDTYLPKDEAFHKAQELLEASRTILISIDDISSACDTLLREERLFAIGDGLMLPSVYYSEVNTAYILDKYMRYELVDQFEEEKIEEAIEHAVSVTGINYDDQQINALKLALTSPISIITGGPGTGKTTIIDGLIQAHAYLHDYDEEEITHPHKTPIKLAAPTGRAAKRMQETTGIPASTIHRLLGYSRESTTDSFYPEEIDGSLLIVDEMSMVDTWLMKWLMDAVSHDLQIVFVGDMDQLPSVGPGQVFKDLIESECIATIRLDKVYRQAEDSSIIALAHEVRQGRLPGDLFEVKKDRSFIQTSTNQLADAVVNIVRQAVERANYTLDDIQVLAPMYKGAAGIDILNQKLQDYFNPAEAGKPTVQHFDNIFRLGDKVLQLTNNTEKGVYNGDIGYIRGIYTSEETKQPEIIVEFDGEKELVYRKEDLNQLTLAYCCSIHKAQGSEYPVVILPMVKAYYRMLRKDLLYTAITRAQKKLVLVGDVEAFHIAASHKDTNRRTFLKDLLQRQVKKKAPTPIIDASQEANEKDVETEAVELEKEEEVNEQEVEEVSQQEQLSLNLFEEEQAVTALPKWLTNDNYLDIDPMIGMEGITPYSFMEKSN